MRFLLPLWLLTTTTAGALGAPLQEPPPAEEESEGTEDTYVEPAEDEDRVTFGFRLDEARGGGLVEVLAGDYEYQIDQYFLGTGGVTIKYRDLQLQADVIRIDVPTNVMTAEGNVVLDEGPRRLVGASLEYDLTNRTGRVIEATAYLDPGYVFTGEEIAKTGTDTYTLDRGVFTSCSEESPPWSIHMSHAEVTVESYARINNARMKFGKLPVFYVPYMLWPTKTERSSGFLVPQPGYSNRRGFELSLGYYKTLGRSADLTFFADLSGEQYYGFGTELRYRPSEQTEGHIEGYLIQDQDFKRLGEIEEPMFLPPGFGPEDLPDENRWKATWFHDTRDLWGGFRGVINIQEFSDPTYRQDFERHTRRQTANFIYSQAYLTRNFGQQSLNLLVDLRERINSRSFMDPDEPTQERRVGQITDIRKQLPEIEYRLRPTQLGSAPIYFSLDANLHYLSIENASLSRRDAAGEPIAEEYGRGDLFPSFSLPLSTLPWLSVKLDAGGRVTHYTNSLDTTTRSFSEQGKELTRKFGIAGAEIVGPSFSRIFEKKKPGRFSKYKHIVEPRFVYSYVDNFDDEAADDQAEVPLFDELDTRRLTNQATVSLINRFLAKPTDEEEGGGFEIASFELQQAMSFDSEIFLQAGNDAAGVRQRIREGPLRAIFRFNPSQATSLKTEAVYNTLFGQMQAASLSGGTRIGPHSLGGSLFTRWGAEEGSEVTSNQARIFTTLALVPNRLTFDANVSFDIEEEELLQQRYFIDYQGSCYSLRFELRESTFGMVTDRDFRFSFTLKNVGTFLDMNGSL